MERNPNLNLHGVSASDELARDTGYETLEHFAHTDPAAIASFLLLETDIQHLGSKQVNLAEPLVVELFDAEPDFSLISMNWGDGSLYDAQQTFFTHFYPAPGVYDASLAVVDNGTLRHFALEVHVSASGPTDMVQLSVPLTPPSVGPTPGFEQFAEVRATIIPEPSALVLALLGITLCLPARRALRGGC